jgi:hypothetical protein
MPKTDDEDARRTLVKLLSRPYDSDSDLEGFDEISESDKLFLISTCSSVMIELAICLTCSFDKAAAVEGVEALMDGMKKHVVQRCEDNNG